MWSNTKRTRIDAITQVWFSAKTNCSWFLLLHIMTNGNWWKENSSSHSSTQTPRVRYIFLCCNTAAAVVNVKIFFKLRKTATETKCLQVFMEMNHCLVSMSLNGLKRSEKDVMTLKMIQGVGSHQLLKIWKQLWKFMN